MPNTWTRLARFASVAFAVASAVSLVLWLATVVLWVRSYPSGDFISRAVGSDQIHLSAWQGQIYAARHRWNIPHDGVASVWTHGAGVPSGAEPLTRSNGANRSAYGFRLAHSQNVFAGGMRLRVELVEAPLWGLTVVTGILPALYIYRWRRRFADAREEEDAVCPE